MKDTMKELSPIPIQNPVEVEGLFINFNNSAIALQNGYGEYIIKAVYESNTSAVKKGQKMYGFDNVWEGKIESSSIKFLVTKKG